MKSLEDDPTFNAGHGSVLNIAGEVEMDAIIMDGRTLSFGAVAGVRNIANPISLARMVMEKTDHVMLAGKGANDFAKEMGIPGVDPQELVSESSRKRWEEYNKYKTVVKDIFNDPKPSGTGGGGDDDDVGGHETVGAVALDLEGNLAAATSTGGISLKKVGRVGDSPLVGSGAYCDNEVGGVSCTGHGESIAKVLLANKALTLVEMDGEKPQRALERALECMLRRVGGRGGMIMVTKKGEIAKCFSAQRMTWASVDQNGKLELGLEGPKLSL